MIETFKTALCALALALTLLAACAQEMTWSTDSVQPPVPTQPVVLELFLN